MSDLLENLDLDRTSLRAKGAPIHTLNRVGWHDAVQRAKQEGLTLLGLWGTRSSVTMALMDEKEGKVGLFDFHPRNRHFPSVGLHFPSAQRLERAIHDLFGLIPDEAPDSRAWIDHGNWETSEPLGHPTEAEPAEYEFLPVEGEGLHQVPVGPVHAGIIEPGHFRFTGQGETIVRLEERLGYTHKGTESLMMGASIERGAELAARVSGDSTVAYGWAYAQAIEAALGTEAPARAQWLRAIMAELERLANHIGDIGGICNDAAFAMMLAQCSAIRERVLRASKAAFGHRFMRDCIFPGGVSVDLTADGIKAVSQLLDDLAVTFPPIIKLYDNTPSILARTVDTGFLSRDRTHRFGAGGFVGRASGRVFDARKAFPYGPYQDLAFDVPIREHGDVDSRIWVRIDEVTQSISLLTQMLSRLPEGPISTELPAPNGASHGVGFVEGFRGDILVFVALERHGRISRCHLRDPSWFQWPLLESVIEGNLIGDFPLCNKSFNCSYSGHDL